jgi:hypothetical protein
VRTVRWLVVVAVMGSGCSSSDTATTSPPAIVSTVPSEPTSTTAATAAVTTTAVPVTTGVADLEVQSTISIGGGQALGLTATDDRVWAVSFDAGTLVSIDPVSNAVDSTVDIAGASSALAVDGDVWVLTFGGRDDLYRVDSSADVVGSYQVGDLCCDLSSDDNIWALSAGGVAYEIARASGDVVAEFAIDVDPNVHINGVFADGAYWYASDTTPLARLDPATTQTVQYDVGGGVPFFARDGLLWGASTDEVWAVDTATGDVIERVSVPDSIEVMALEVVESSVFVGIRHPGRVGAVMHLDRTTGDVLGEFDVDIPARMTLAFDSLWVTDSGSDTVVRIGPIIMT